MKKSLHENGELYAGNRHWNVAVIDASILQSSFYGIIREIDRQTDRQRERNGQRSEGRWREGGREGDRKKERERQRYMPRR
jgi:hypothetical protein